MTISCILPRRGGKTHFTMRRLQKLINNGETIAVVYPTQQTAKYSMNNFISNYCLPNVNVNKSKMSVENILFSGPQIWGRSDTVIIEEVDKVLECMFRAKVDTITGTMLRVPNQTQISQKDLEELKWDLSKDQFRQEFVCKYDEEIDG